MRMRREEMARGFAARRRRMLARILAWAGAALLAIGLLALAITLRPLWLAALRESAAEDSPLPAAELPPASAARESAKGPMRVWLAGVSNQAVDPTVSSPDIPDASAPGADDAPAPPADPWEPYLSGERMVLRITPPEGLNGGKTIKIVFAPGDSCAYGSGRACVSRHRNGQVTLLTVHSGLGGEGEAFRSAVEGTGLDLAFYSFAQIRQNMGALAGAPARLQSGELNRDDLNLAAVTRIPPRRLAEYFEMPFDQALADEALQSPVLQAALDSGEPLLMFEICGWQIPGEEMAPQVSPTTASIYLGVIRIQ
jgi:hypothetical protein